jgi:hypothetical protein
LATAGGCGAVALYQSVGGADAGKDTAEMGEMFREKGGESFLPTE